MVKRPNFRHVHYNNCLKCKHSAIEAKFGDEQWYCGFEQSEAWKQRVYNWDVPRGAVEVFESTICDNFKLAKGVI